MSDKEQRIDNAVNAGENADTRVKAAVDPVFYYSREHRLSKASQRVRDLNEGKMGRPSLSKSLFDTRGNVFLFASIVLICAMFGIAARYGRVERSIKLGGNTLEVAIRPEEGVLILTVIKKAPGSGESYTGPVDIAVSPVLPRPKEGEAAEAPAMFAHRVYFNPVVSETSRIILPFEGNDFFVILRTDYEQRSLRLNAK